jgi:probable addiction module antidote protein
MATKTIPFDAAEHLRSPEDQAELLNDAFESGNAAYIANALGIVARARGISEVARGAGVTREALFSDKGDPKLTTLLGVLKTVAIFVSAKQKMFALLGCVLLGFAREDHERRGNAVLPAELRWALARQNVQVLGPREAGPLPIMGAQGTRA